MVGRVQSVAFQGIEVLAVDVQANLLGRTDRNSLAVDQLDLRIPLVQVLSAADVAHAAHRLDLAGILDQDHVEDPVGR